MIMLRPSFASGALIPYLAGMAILPRPVSPRSALADLKLMFSPDRPHRWGLLGVSAAVTGVLLWGFVLDTRLPPKKEQIFYITSWASNRKDSDIIRQQLKDLDDNEAKLRAVQERYQKFADASGIEWRKEEAEGRAARDKDRAAMKKILETKLAAALAKEAAAGETDSDAVVPLVAIPQKKP